MSEGQTTTDHSVIRDWIEARGGRPSRVKGTGGHDDAGLLRIDFGDAEDALEEISWADFFATFEHSGLAFLYQEADDSRFNKFIRRPSK